MRPDLRLLPFGSGGFPPVMEEPDQESRLRMTTAGVVLKGGAAAGLFLP